MVNHKRIFFKRAKILATVGPASNSLETLSEMIHAGVNGLRLNFSHGTQEQHGIDLKTIREASKAVGKPVAVVQDLQGPKIRLGDFEGTVSVKRGEQWTLVYGRQVKDTHELPVQYDISQKVKAGERLYMFDGKVKSQITSVKKDGVVIRIENDGVLLSRKGINLPDTNFAGDVLPRKDVDDVTFGAGLDIDYVAMSFVQTAEDVKKLRALLRKLDSPAKIITKIETPSAIREENLEAIIMVSDAVMVARGDLATETSPEIVPIVQRKILELAQKHGKISIVATQMLASMQMNPEPTRAEISDVASAVMSGADCVMLSEETAVGNYPVEAVATMKRVILYTQEHAPVHPLFYSEFNATMQDAISSAAVTLAHQIKAQAIVCGTKSGVTALSIASHRPSLPIISVTSNQRVAQQLCLMYACKSFVMHYGEKAGLEVAQKLKEMDILKSSIPVVMVSGRQPGVVGGTDTIRVRTLE